MKKLSACIAVMACAAVMMFSGCSFVTDMNVSGGRTAIAEEQLQAEQAPDVQYVLYLGTNDKDTDEPVFTPEESKAKAKEILIQRFGGYTIQDAEGGWIGDDGTVYQEFTIIIHLSDTTLDDVHAVCDEFVEVFHQSSVLIQENRTTTEFYSGKQA